MIPTHPTNDDVNPPLAIGSGIAAGLATLAVVAGLVWLAGRSGDNGGEVASPLSRIGTTVSNGELLAGDCFDFTAGSSAIRQFRVANCDTSHLAQVTAKVTHPDAGGDYPGADSLKAWLGERCDSLTEVRIRHADHLDITDLGVAV